MATADQPPTPDSFTHVIDLTSTTDSKISAVSVYASRAEITRVFHAQLNTGQNRVNISGLPNVLYDDSVRLEGRGPAIIHDVSTTTSPQPVKQSTSPEMDDLVSRKEYTVKELERCKTLHEAMGKYLATLHVKHIDVGELDKIVQGYKATCGKLDDDILDLEKQLKAIEEDIQKEAEKEREKQRDKSRLLRKKVSLSLFAERESEVEIILTYAVSAASWSALYELRVDMEAKETPITLVYKASITQNTAEEWKDVPLRLETAAPTFGIELPSLSPWTLSVYRPPPPPAPPPPAPLQRSAMLGHTSGPFMAKKLQSVPEEESSEELSRILEFRGAAVTSKGNVSATFDVPGITTIPCDNTTHHVAITTLKLDAAMSWIAIPKSDARTRISAKIKNTSEYTLLRGTGSIYVDGSFIAKSTIPAVSPGESFDCALGLDPAIRVTYHPLSKKTSTSGFYSKTAVTAYLQRISIHNTKSIAIDNLRIVDQVPVSTDEKIVVKLSNPPLPNVQTDTSTGTSLSTKTAPEGSGSKKIKVTQGVVAQWGDAALEDGGATAAGGDSEEATVAGKDGKLSWVCLVPSQAKINLSLQWEVAAPVQVRISEF